MSTVMVTIIGNLAADPELRFTPSGDAVATFTVMTSKSRKDPQTNEWVESKVTGYRCTAWKQLGENVAESLQKGDAVVVYGEQAWRSWEKDGEKQGRMEVEAWHVAADLKRRAVKVIRTERAPAQSRPADPWAAPGEEPPF